MGILSKKLDPSKTDTIIGNKTVFEGVLSAAGGIRIEGVVRGRVDVQGLLVVGHGGKIEADIVAENAIVGGEIIGNITARNRLELRSKGKVYGDITTTHLVMQEGVIFQGTCRMITDEAICYPRIARTEALPEAVGSEE